MSERQLEALLKIAKKFEAVAIPLVAINKWEDRDLAAGKKAMDFLRDEYADCLDHLTMAVIGGKVRELLQ